MGRILEVARAERNQNAFRFKETGTLERHDVEIADVRKVYVRLTPSPGKHIIADFVVGDGAVYRLRQDRTLIDYRTFLEDVEPGGLQNFRKLVASCVELMGSEQADPATADFGNGSPPEAFNSPEELQAYEAYLVGDSDELPVPAEAAELDPEQIEDKKARAEVIWKQYGDDLRASEAASSSGLDPRWGGYGLVILGFLIVAGGVAAGVVVLSLETGSPLELLGIVGLGVAVGISFLLAGLVVLRRAELRQQERES